MIRKKKHNSSNTKRVIIHIDSSTKNARFLIEGILKYAYENANWLVHRTPSRCKKIMDFDSMFSSLSDWKPDGIIINTGEFPVEIQRKGIPIIAGPDVRNVPDDAYHIIDNSETITKMAANYLMLKGFKRFAYCGIDRDWSYRREEYFVNEIKNAGFEISTFKPLEDNAAYSWKQDLDSIVAWLRSMEYPTALLACNDSRAEDVIVACHIADIEIPRDIIILGIDNDDFCETIKPELSSVAFDSYKNSYIIAEVLDKLMNGEKVESKILYTNPSHIVTRQSTESTAVTDEIVSKALNYINNNYGRVTTVEDIAAFVNVSTSELRKRFRKTLNSSVQQELTQRRVEFISQLLRKTDLTLSQIAARLGYPSEGKYVARFFKSTVGITPYEYRKHYQRQTL